VASDEDGTHRPKSVTIALRCPVDPLGADDIFQCAQAYLDAGGREVTCEITGVVDLSLVDTFGRLLLITRRHGARLYVKENGCAPELAALLAYLGLGDLLEPGRQSEAGE
jgi:hypothetical protein